MSVGTVHSKDNTYSENSNVQQVTKTTVPEF